MGGDEVVQYIWREDCGYEFVICMRLLGCVALRCLSVKSFVVVGVAVLYGGDVVGGLGGLLTIASGWQFEMPVWVKRAQALLIGLPYFLELLLGIWVFCEWWEDFGGKVLLYLPGREHLRVVCAGLELGTSYVVPDV